MRSKLILVCLSISLLLPFALREGILPIRTEPYPAVLFPAGAKSIRLDEQFLPSRRLEMFSLDSNQVEHKLPRTEFMYPIPAQNLPFLASNLRKFGLTTEKHKTISFGSGSWQLIAKRHRSSTSQEKREVIKWLTERLRAVGRPNDRTIIVRSILVQIDTVTGDEVNSEINYQYEINLDEYSS